MGERIVVIGGTRSGKSAVAEDLAAGGGRGVTYVATGTAGDEEMAARIAAHRARRPASWATAETDDVAAAIRRATPGDAILVDSLGTWLTRRMDAHQLWPATGRTVAPTPAADALLAEADAFWAAAAAHPGGPVILVAEDAGAGLVPPDAGTRRWVDLHGEVLQRVAAEADRVLHVVAGRSVELPPAPAASAPARGDLRVHGDRQVQPGALDFAVNVHGDGPPEHVRKAIDAALSNVAAYPEDLPARTAVADRHGRAPDEVAVTAGAAEAFWLLPRVLRIRRAALVHPSFTEPEAALRAAGVPVAHVLRDPATGWSLEPSAVPDEAELVVVGNPNNPTGTLDAAEDVARLCRPGRVTVVDEAFMDFVPDETASVAARGDLPGLVVVRSVTKLWGLAGLRAGYLLAPAGLVERLAAHRQPWPVAGPALAAIAACVGDDAWRRCAAEQVAADRAGLVADLRRLPGVTVWEGAANFVLLRVHDGPATVRALGDAGISVRPSTFPGLDEHYLRVAVRAPEDNRRLVAALDAALSGRSR